MIVHKFTCGFCKDKGKNFTSSRSGLREHLREEHIRNKSLTNLSSKPSETKHKQSWWIKNEM